MKKLVTGLILGLCCWAAATVSHATNYALCTGLNKYTNPGCTDLSGCVPDAKNVYTNITLRGEWLKANATIFTNAQGTFAAVSNKLMSLAATAVSGDVVLYYHSSHGYQSSGKNTGICMYDKDMSDSAFAKILANFKAGVKVVIVLDTCHSGGMFKGVRRDDATALVSPFAFAQRVNEELAAIRADEAARGIRTSAKLAVLDCGWISAADYDQYSWDGDDGKGGAFTECFVGSVKSGACDKSPYGNGDSYATFKEMFDYAVVQDETHGDGNPSSEDYTMPQCTNTTLLAAVTFGWVGKEAPSGVRFAPIPDQTATVGAPLAYTLVASNADGSTGTITYSVASSTAPSGSYSLSGADFTFTPPADGTFTFNFVGTNKTAGTFGKASMNVAATLAVPSGLDNSGITDSSFTANWDAVPGAASYVLEVFAADEASPSAKAADGAFALVTSKDGLTEGEYVIVAENADIAMGNTCSGASSGYLSCTDVSVESASVSTDDAAIIWTLAGDAFSCTLFNAAAGKFANPSASKANVGWADTASGAWTLSLSDGIVTAANAKDSSWILQYNSSAPRFACYSSNLKKLRFFRRDGASGAVFSADVGNVTSYTVEGLIPGDYTWRVRAVGNAKGPWSETQDVTLFADPSAPPSIRAIADIEIDVGETATATVAVSTPEQAPVTSLSITDGDPAATLEDGVFSFAPAAPGTYEFTLTAVNANGSATASFSVIASLADPETPVAPAEGVASDSFTASWEAVPGAASYELDVIQGATSGGGGSGGGSGGDVVLSESFASVVSNSAAIKDFDDVTTNKGWSGENAYPADGMVKFGTSSKAGTFQSPSVAVSGTVTVTWTGKSWHNDNASVNVGVSVDGGSTFTETSVSLTESLDTYTTSLPVSGSSAIVRWQSSSASRQRFFISELSISSGSKARDLDGNHVEGFPKNVGNVTSYEVTGLQSSTEYTFAFRAIAGDETTDWSEPVTVKTTEGPAAPAWSAIPAQTASIGHKFTIDLAGYVTGSPTPTLSLTAGDASIDGTVLSFTPAEGGEYAFTVNAHNGSGDAATSFTVTAVEHVPTKYAVCIGINEYNEITSLAGCVNDSKYMEQNLVERGGWAAENVVRLNDSKATKAAIRKAIADVAAKAQAGDTFVYQHSSHGGQFNATEDDEDPLTGEEGKDTFLCVYDEVYEDNTTAYNDYEIAADMQAFPAGVKVVVIVDACHSGGLFKSKQAARASAKSFDLAGRVTAIMEADRAARKARGENVAKSLSPAEIGWATAAEYYEYSYDGGFYHTDEWLTNNVYGDEYYNETTQEYNYPSSYKLGGVFLASSTWNWWNGDADTDGDGSVDVHEFWQKGYDFCSVIGEFWYEDATYNYYPQCTNVDVLKSVELGYAGTPTLDAPVAAEAADVTASSFTASWSAVADATGYRIQVATDPSFSTGAAADTIVADDLAATSTSYTAFSGVAKGSGAVYAGKSAKNSEGAIQLNNKAETGAGIWTTASGGNASRVAVEWNSTTAAKRSLQIYGSDTALTSYSAVKAATLLGTIDYGSASDLAIDGTYAYVGILANGGAVYLDSVSVDWGVAGSGSSIVLDDNVGNVTACDVSGLEPETDYWYRVQALGDPVDSDFSNVIALTTEASTPTAPVWSDIPPQTAVAGEDLVVDLKPYVTGSPKPTITADAGTVENGVLTVSFADAGDYTVNLTAENSEGSVNAQLSVSVTAGPVDIPTLALSNPTSEGFDASWDACTGVSSYTLQIALDDQFTTGGGGGDGAVVTETFAKAEFSTTSSSYVEQTITGGDLGTWTATSCRGDDKAPIIRYAGTLTSPSLAGGVAAVEFDYEWPYKESGTCGIDLYVNDSKVGSATVTGGESGTASYTGFTAVAGPATVELRNTGTSNKRMMVTQVRITSATKSVAKDGEGSLVKELTVEDTSTTVTGLDPETLYYARVKGASDWSEVQSITTLSDEPTAPVWLELPAQTATVGLEFGIDLSIYVTGSPLPAITVDGQPTDGGAWVHTFAEAGTNTYTLVADNGVGEPAQATLTVVVKEAPPAKYALCVGLIEFDPEFYGDDLEPLVGAVNDATTLRANLVERGGWPEADTTVLTNAAATKEAIRGAIAGYAEKAKAGDTFVLQFSTHGGGDDEEGYDLAVYDQDYTDEDLAEDLLAFESGVKIVVLIDACHSAGMIARGAKSAPAPFAIAERVSALIDAARAARKARGEDIARSISADEIGWVTAADFAENSQDGGYYDTDEWMSGDDVKGDVPGGVFLTSFTWGWKTGKADVSGTGDGDGWFDALEGWSFSGPVCDEAGHHPQFFHEDVLRSVELGWIGEAAPSEAILFDPVPGVTVGIGEEAVLEGIVARNADGTTDGITLAIVDPTPEEADYTFADGKLTFTPDEDGLFLFTVRATSGRTSATKLLGVTATLPAPVALEATDKTDTSFTANWEGVAATIRAYQLQVSTDPSFPDADPDILIQEGFDGVTDKTTLPEGWSWDAGTFDTYKGASYCGEAAPSIKFSSSTGVLTSPTFKLSGKSGLRFWTLGNSTNMTSTLKVELLVGGEWTELETFVPSSEGETKEYEDIDSSATQVRFTYTRNTGNVALDDVLVLSVPPTAATVVDEDEIAPADTSYLVKDLTPGTLYYYRVRAIANTKSAWSETIEVTTAGEAPIPVPDLTALSPETSPDTTLVAFWLCPGATKFRLQVATDEEFVSLVFDEELAESATTVTGLTPETTYYVRVCALDGERVGDWSEVQNVTTAAGGELVQADIEDVTIDGTARTMKFAVPANATVMTTTNLVTGPWVEYQGEFDGEGNVVIPLTGTAAFFRLGDPPAGD